MTGFPDTQGHFLLPRSTITPTKRASDAFLSLLQMLRVTFLQDAVFMQQRFLNHPFSDTLFLRFKSDMLQAVATQTDPSDLLLQRTVPLIEQKLASLHRHMETMSQNVQANFEWAVTQETTHQIPSTDVVDPSAASVSDAETLPLHDQADPTNHPPAYRLSRSIKNVNDLWREWTVGLGGEYSVKLLDYQWGRRWPSDDYVVPLK
ncbi:uncharacterized protein BYT42DRAFT_613278 [Radiomyces spectabilis]|uniref:uncharacterized protein n=1 Tax=Radiomyces spectabilis TaxID=64574 RepID=UPI00221EEC36|nr:uncharacterized protein BYT42DRAFT_613278 [Radiomyces spectabilis]KAI8381505.1 hypothetical protein BYT42DRAFT_613278 [Radiomyces spectabilis]